MEQLEKYPLYPFYQAIKGYDESLGHEAISFETYLLFLKKVQYGYGLLDKEDFYVLCLTLFFKPHHQKRAFKKLFLRYLASFIKEQETQPKSSDNVKDGGTRGEDTDFQDMDDYLEDDYLEFDPEDELLKETIEEKNEGNFIQKKSYQKVSIHFDKSDKGIIIEKPSEIEIQDIEHGIYGQKFILKGSHLPLSLRKLQQGINSLRAFNFSREQNEIDIEATVERIAEIGYFEQLIFKRNTEALIPLTLLIDWSPTMIAFNHIADELIQATYAKYKNVGHQVYFFHDYPIKHIYKDRERIQPYRIELLRKEKNRSFLIFSDLGAALTTDTDDRKKHIREFVEQIKHRPHVWLNPMPEKRWTDSTAAIIAKEFPVFDISPIGFSRAMRWLKKLNAK